MNGLALIFGGMYIDQVSMRASFALFFMVSLVANLLLSIGGAAGSWATFIIGRVFFMIATELLLICSLITIINMFFSTGINYPLGLATIVPFFGIILSECFSPGLSSN